MMKNIALILILSIISCQDNNIKTKVSTNMDVDNLNNGYAELQARNFTEAIKYFNKVIENLSFTESPMLVSRSYLLRGSAKGELGDTRGALSDFTKIIKESRVKDFIAEAYYMRGITHLNMNNIDLACSDWSKSGEMGIEISYKFIRENCDY